MSNITFTLPWSRQLLDLYNLLGYGRLHWCPINPCRLVCRRLYKVWFKNVALLSEEVTRESNRHISS